MSSTFYSLEIFFLFIILSGISLVVKSEEHSGISVLPQLIDPEDFPLKGLSDEQALDLLFQRYRARMLESHEPRMFPLEDLSDKEIAEICGNSASLECGKKVLKYTDNSGDSPTVQRRCNLRKEFLDCIDLGRKNCRRQAEKGIYPRLPPKSIIRSTQSKIWRALWTSGGCVLTY